ncbi:MAG: hypothetical protein PWP45_406 [Tepidanaerobacteraceae bacterium]|nr:hypothetical protein [Tepidanaerobacteraceae bacterium]
MFKILKGGRLFSPNDMGKKDLLIAGSIVANIAEEISPADDYGEVEVIDVSSKIRSTRISRSARPYYRWWRRGRFCLPYPRSHAE